MRRPLTCEIQFTSYSGRTRILTCNDARKAEFNEIPTISLKDPENDIISQLREACTQVGFFYIKVGIVAVITCLRSC